MDSKQDLERTVLQATREHGIGTILFRNALAKKLGLNLTESLCLTILGIKIASTPTELARYIGLTTGATTALLDRLEKRSFIRRKPNPRDRRGLIIEIDETYAQRAKGLVAGIQKAHRELIAGYSEKQLEVIAEFLHRLARKLGEQAEKIGGEA
jgi:DNA-binding MarR family transcriptional regulator